MTVSFQQKVEENYSTIKESLSDNNEIEYNGDTSIFNNTSSFHFVLDTVSSSSNNSKDDDDFIKKLKEELIKNNLASKETEKEKKEYLEKMKVSDSNNFRIFEEKNEDLNLLVLRESNLGVYFETNSNIQLDQNINQEFNAYDIYSKESKTTFQTLA